LNLAQSVTLGVVQGLTEFLPISSTAHLKIVPALLHWKDPGAPATAVIQLGTVVAVIAYFARDLWAMTRALFGALRPGGDRTSPEARLALAVVVGTLPVCILGLLLKHKIETVFRSNYVIAFAMIAMAVVLFLADRLIPKRRPLEDITVKDGLIVGLMQALALIPGSSRSGSTLTGAYLTGLDAAAAVRFSFLLSVPATALAGLFELKDFLKPETMSPEVAAQTMTWTKPDLLIATIVAGVVGYASIAWLLNYLRKHPPLVFVIYRIVVGLALIGLISAGYIAKQ
jgi:undecaprenyl-diphosphatase